jgi:hypothetical protein
MPMTKMARATTILALAGLATSPPAWTQPMGGPPPEAFAACQDKAAGTTCSHPIPSGTIEGTCQPRGERMQCIPARGPGGGGPGGGGPGRGPGGGPQLDAQCNEIDRMPSPGVTFPTLPVAHQRTHPLPFTLPDGRTHWYEAVYLPQGGVNWVQAKSLAEQAGGYLVTLHSRAENDFVFGLIADRKFWFAWDGSHNHVMNGPFLGGCQPAGSSEPRGGWRWVTGEPWSYENWAWEGMPGDRDPRPSGQPNDATGNQNVTAFGEVNEPVATWGDFPHKFSSFQSQHDGKAYGFVIEYDAPPR